MCCGVLRCVVMRACCGVVWYVKGEIEASGCEARRLFVYCVMWWSVFERHLVCGVGGWGLEFWMTTVVRIRAAERTITGDLGWW